MSATTPVPDLMKALKQSLLPEPEFEPFPKLSRLHRGIIVTEKLDGTNAQIYVTEDGRIWAGSRNRWLSPGKQDNFGFAAWVNDNALELIEKLGPGRHYGEWWGQGIQRTYGLAEKRFSLFNTDRWADDNVRPECCHVVPVLLQHGSFDHLLIEACMDLLVRGGSVAAAGYGDPEGIVVFHTHSRQGFKYTLDKNDAHKGAAA